MEKFDIKFYNGVKKIVDVPYKLIMKKEIIGLENLPKKPYILAGNHKSMCDIFLLVTSIPDAIHFISKKELFDIKLLGMFLSKMGAIPIDRNKADMSAVRAGISVLNDGEVLGIFPEGTRNKTDDIILPFKRGINIFASKTNSLVVPFGISGDYKLGKTVTLNIGEPFDLNKIEKENQTIYIEERVKELILQNNKF